MHVNPNFILQHISLRPQPLPASLATSTPAQHKTTPQLCAVEKVKFELLIILNAEAFFQ